MQRWWFRRGSRLGRVGVVAVVAAVAWVAVGCSGVSGHPKAASNTMPFYAAIADLLAQPVAHYTSPDSRGASWDMRVTAGKYALGSITRDGQVTEVLSTESLSYAKPPKNVLAANLPRGRSVSDLEGKWVTGSDAFTDAVPRKLTPAELGGKLLGALNRAPEFPRVGDPTVQIGSDRAYEVVTPKGTLAVTAEAPHRLLRFVPDLDADSTTPTTTVMPDSSATSLHDPLLTPILFLPMTSADRDRAYNDIAAQVQTLNTAADIGVQFDFNAAGEMTCTNESCTVTSNITASTLATSSSRLRGAIDVIMTASITVDGAPSAGCSAARTIPSNGVSTLTCVDASIAPLVAAAGARAQAEADAQSRAQGRSVTVEYAINYRGSIDVRAVGMAQVEVDRQVGVVRSAQDAARDGASCGPGCTYKQIPYNSDKPSRAANDARAAGGVSPTSNIAVAVVPGWNDPVNGDLVIGSGEGEQDNAAGKSVADLVAQMTARGFNPGRITELYSERQPCLVGCGAALQGLPAESAISYTIPWKKGDAGVLDAGNEVMERLISEGSGR